MNDAVDVVEQFSICLLYLFSTIIIFICNAHFDVLCNISLQNNNVELYIVILLVHIFTEII